MSSFIVLGAGQAAENFIFALAHSKMSVNSIIQLASDAFYPACSLRSTAIVAARGISTGHSDLGNILVDAYQRFLEHVEKDKPRGVFLGTQWTGTSIKVDEFKKRYPDGELTHEISELSFKLNREFYLSSEPCFIIDPSLYLEWLRSQSNELKVERRNEAVTEINREGDEWVVSTQTGGTYRAQKIFMGVGSYQSFWKELHPKESVIQTSSPVQGSYLVYENIHLGEKYFSLTLDGCNLIYHPHTQKLIIGSTTVKASHHMPDEKALKEIDRSLRECFPEMSWPPFEKAIIQTGLREKARARRPYLEYQQGLVCCGGLYKNGYSLGPYLAEKAVDLFRNK